MVRILSGLVLIPVFFSCIWFLPTLALLVVAEGVLVLAFVEYARLAAGLGAQVPRAASLAAAMGLCAALGLGLPLELPLAAGLVGLGALIIGARTPSPGVLADTAGAAFPMLYLGLPLGSLVALHALAGREAVMLLLLTIVVSDTAQVLHRARVRSPQALARHQPEEDARGSDWRLRPRARGAGVRGALVAARPVHRLGSARRAGDRRTRHRG